MPEPRKLRVFLCHASQDKPIVRELYQRLLAEGWIDPWLDEEKLFPGQDWDMEIEKAVEVADAVIVCLSTNSVTNEGYIQRELRFVLDIADYKPEETVFVIPVRLDDCPAPRRLRRWQYVDYFPDDRRQRSYQRLQQSLELRFGQKYSRDMTDAIDDGKRKVDSKNDLLGDDFPIKDSLESRKPIEGSVTRESSNISTSSPHKISTICMETAGGVSMPIYYTGDPIPFKKSIVYSTAEDNQKKVEVHLVLGENKMAKDNVSLGKYSIDGIPPAQKGVPRIEIQFELDSDFNLSIATTEKATGLVKHLGDIALTDYSAPPVKDRLPPKSENSSPNGLLDNSNSFSDFFQAIFGMGAGQSPQRFQQEIELTLEDAYKGSTHRIQIDGKEKLVRIPAGVLTGSKVRVAGAGPHGLDIYLIISVQPHLFFIRHGADLYMQYPVSKELAFSGGELQVPVLGKGKFIYIAIPPNTKDKQVFRFTNRGIPKLKEPTKFGDFYLAIDIYDPQNMHPRFKKLLDDINYYMK